MSKIFKFYIEIRAININEAREVLNELNDQPLDCLLNCDD